MTKRHVNRFAAGALLGLLVAVSVSTVGYAQAPEKSPVPPMPGRLVATDAGHKLHLWCTGEGAAPTVVLVNGGGGFSIGWESVRPAIAANARVCAYDRAGFAWSEKGPAPRGVGVSADELHQVLRRAEVLQPYVLVGISMGGSIARVFAHKYPDEVSGMVLIDTMLQGPVDTAPVADELRNSLDPTAEEESNQARPLPPEMRAASTWATNLSRQEQPPPTIRDGKVEIRIARGMFPLPMWLETSDLSEPIQALKATTASTQVPLGDKPLFVISAGRLSWDAQARASGDSYMTALLAAIGKQAYLAGLSRNSQFLVARASYHNVPAYEPQLVTAAILKVLTAARTGERLKPVN